MPTPPVPTADTRWRCSLCGNLTRFDVTRTTRARDYLHFDLAGDSRVDEHEVLGETVEEVRCRWCNQVDTVELVSRADSGDSGDSADRETPESTEGQAAS